MQNNNKKSVYGSIYNAVSIDLDCKIPMIEMTGNRRITVEGSTGVLLYESGNIKINTPKMVISFCGRGLAVRCISDSCVEIEGFVTGVEFLT